MIALKIILCILFGYCIGGVNPSYIVGRLRGFDIRQRGSGNAGASNAVITMGKKVGVASAIFDILKATAAYCFAPLIFKELVFAAEIAGAACILGHIYPAYMKFKGGKGLACLGGVVLGIDWRFFLILLTGAILLALVTDYICSVPIVFSILYPLCYVWFGDSGAGLFINAHHGWWGAAILGIASLAMLARHIQNIKRIINGTELHFSYLWKKNDKKKEELARIGQVEKDTPDQNANDEEAK